ncbi:MazG family protein, partial [bacterium]|nr:MazG family protein [bacterium]
EEGRFSVVDPVRALSEKMIERHPHVFGDLKLETADDVRDEWERIKLRNKDEKKEKQGTLSGVPPALPALTRAYRVQEKMAGVGFDWENPDGALTKLREEVEELHRAIHEGDPEAVEEEIGDVLFSVVNSARLAGYGSEEALRRTIEKVIDRFSRVEAMVNEDGQNVTELTLEKLDSYWDRAKLEQRKHNKKQSSPS